MKKGKKRNNKKSKVDLVFNCDICNIQFAKKNKLLDHFQSTHTSKTVLSKSNSESKIKETTSAKNKKLRLQKCLNEAKSDYLSESDDSIEDNLILTITKTQFTKNQHLISQKEQSTREMRLKIPHNYQTRTNNELNKRLLREKSKPNKPILKMENNKKLTKNEQNKKRNFNDFNEKNNDYAKNKKSRVTFSLPETKKNKNANNQNYSNCVTDPLDIDQAESSSSNEDNNQYYTSVIISESDDSDCELIDENNYNEQYNEIREDNDYCDEKPDPNKRTSSKLRQNKKIKIKLLKNNEEVIDIDDEQEEVEQEEEGEKKPLSISRKQPICNFCNKIFSSPSSLISHVRIHTGEKPYICSMEMCQKSFFTLDALKKHQRTHTGEKPYSCPQCDKKFTQSSSVKTHMRIHNGQKCFTCQCCEKAFYTLGNLNKHLKVHMESISLPGQHEPPTTVTSDNNFVQSSFDQYHHTNYLLQNSSSGQNIDKISTDPCKTFEQSYIDSLRKY